MAKNGKCKAGYYYCYTDEKCKPIPKGFKMVGRAGYLRKENGHSVDDDENKNGNGSNGNGSNGNGNGSNGNGNGGGVSESKSGDSSLRDWFGKSKSSDGKPGWVQLGGKYAGKPCAKQPGQTTKPKCGSSKMKRNLSKDEEQAAFRRKNAKDPNPNRSGKAINVKTEETKKDHEFSMARSEIKTIKNAASRLEKKMGKKGEGELKAWVQSKITKAADYIDTAADYVANEEFTTLPLQIEVPTEIRDFNLGLMFRESLDINSGMLFIFDEVCKQSFHMTETKIPLDIAFIREDGIIESIKQLEPNDTNPVSSDYEIICALEVNRGWFAENNVEVGDEIDIEEAAGEKDACYHKVKSRYSVWPSAYASGALVKCRKKGAANWGNKTKKEEFSNWRSEYKPTEYEFTDIITPEPLQPTEGIGSKMLDEKHDTPKNVKGIAKELDKAVEMHKNQAKRLRKAGISEDSLDEKCWKGYTKKGMKTMFGKRYPNCVKKEEIEQIDEKEGCMHNHKGEECPVHGAKECPALEKVDEAIQVPRKTGNIIMVYLTFRGKMYGIKMFFPSVRVPSRSDIQGQIEKVYPGGKVRSYQVSDYEPGEPVLHSEGAAWTKKSGKNKEGGLNEKGRKSYEKENPGSDLKAPSKKVGNSRRASFCARMKGMKKKLTSAKTARDPDSRINKSLRAWNC